MSLLMNNMSGDPFSYMKGCIYKVDLFFSTAFIFSDSPKLNVLEFRIGDPFALLPWPKVSFYV